jgi:hypothetical protein
MGGSASVQTSIASTKSTREQLTDKEELFLSRQFYQKFETIYTNAKVEYMALHDFMLIFGSCLIHNIFHFVSIIIERE